MSKAHDQNTAIGMVVLGILLAYGGYGALKGNVFQSAFIGGGIILVLVGAYILAKTLGLIQTGKKT